MPKIKNGALDQYGDEPFKHQLAGTAGVGWVKPAGLAFSAHYKIVILTRIIQTSFL